MLKLTRHLSAALVGAALMTPGLFATQVSAETRELVFDVFIPSRAALHSVGMVEFAQEVEEASNGTLKLTIPAAPLGPPPRIFDMVEDGVADIALVPVIYRDNITLPLINDIVGLADSAVTASVATWRTHKEHFEAADQWGPIIPITIFAHSDEQIFTTKKAVNSVADVEGMKFIAPSKLHSDRVDALGGVPVGAPQMKMFEMTNGGVVDGVIVPFGPAFFQGLAGVAEKVTTIPGGFGRPAFAVIMNREVFEDLTEEQQDAILSAGGEKLAAKLGGIAQRESEFSIGKFQEANATITEGSPELIAAVEEKLAFIEEDWLKDAEAAGIDGPAALAYYREVVKQMEGQ